jgi:hypothetical protein
MSEPEGAQPEAPKPVPRPESHGEVRAQSLSEIEYRSLTSYFERLVKYTYGAVLFVLTLAGVFLWRNISDVKRDADTAIVATKDTAAQEISKIGKDASAEAQKSVNDALSAPNIQQMIERTTREKVDKAVDLAIEKNLGARINDFEKEIAAIGEVSNQGARLQLAYRPALDALVKEMQNDPSKTVRDYAKSTLMQVGSDFEARVKLAAPGQPGLPLSQIERAAFGPSPPKTLREVLVLIPQSTKVTEVTASFLIFREMTGTQVQVFDISAAERWCAEHRPRCE